MWIVEVALKRPLTFIVLALLLVIFGTLSILRTPTDIFPNIGIPVVSVVWGYTGMPPRDMGTRVTANFERALTTTVNDIEHIESQSLTSMGVVKIFFQPSVNVDMAVAQVTAIAQTMLRHLPPGIDPPLILSFNASSVPIIQLALSSRTLPEQQLFDLGNSFIRTQLASVQGASIPYPYGGKQRQIQVDIDPRSLRSNGLTPQDVSNALAAQNLILPAGTEKIGNYEYQVNLNASTDLVSQLNDLPLKRINGSPLFLRDVAHVRDGYAPQVNIVRVNGERAALMTIQKSGAASTLDIISRVKDRLPLIRESMPAALTITPISDQSTFVAGAVEGVVREGVIAAALTGLMILLFLGSWRSTLIITISIPLSVLASIITLSLMGQTINIMTLGGLALAVGILVDDATVAIENINWHLEQGKPVERAILDGAEQIAVPALVSTLCICIVFVPMFFLGGVAKFLFVPMAEAVCFAMIASYILSRTLIPTLAKYWLRAHDPAAHHLPPKHVGVRLQRAFERGFEWLRRRYRTLLAMALINRGSVVAGFMLLVVCSLMLVPWLGRDFFPAVDAGQIKLHMRAHAGTRVEETARLADLVENTVRTVIPATQIDSIIDNIGVPVSGINLSYSNSAPVGPGDADLMISLKPGHGPTADYVRKLREVLSRAYPDVMFAFLPADMVGQILNFGSPAPVDIQVAGFDDAANHRYANELLEKIRHIPGIVDLRIQQQEDYPTLDVTVDRARAQQLGLTQRDVATNVLISLSGSFQTAANFWMNPKTGVSYNVAVQTPQYKLDSVQALKDQPILSAATGTQAQVLGSVARVTRAFSPAVVSHYDVRPVVDIYAAVQDRDLGSVAADIDAVLKATAKDKPKGATVDVRGQVQTMRSSFVGLVGGLAFAIVLVYLLIVVNFQSWLDPFIIITALPGALAGITWMLFITHTTLTVPALTGAIMCMGVATANSILVVSYARERMTFGRAPMMAALEAGFTRFRPVLMTALAMIIGMVPMALGLGDGGEQNAPLGRAVIGGLIFATVSTLFFVPVVFCLLHGRGAVRNKAA